MFDLGQFLPAHDSERLLFDIVLVLSLGVLLAMLAQKLKQSVIVGYILAGILLGPHAFNLVGVQEAFPFMADIGIALLLFTIGLEMSWSSLRHSKHLSLKFGFFQVIATGLIGGLFFYLWGLAVVETILLGMIVALSSTAAVLHILTSRSEMDSMHGRIALSVLLVQDVITIFFLLLIPEFSDGQTALVILSATGVATIKLVIVSLGLIVFERVVLRRLFKHAASNPEGETLVLMSLSVALGVAGITAALGLSPALGAFLVGLLLGDAPYSDQARAEIGPLRIGMLVLFFAYVGMTVDLNWLVEHLLIVVIFAVAVVIIKTSVLAVILKFAKFNWRHAILSGVVISQLGEFSLVVAVLGLDAGALSEYYFQLAVSTVLLTIIATPALINAAVNFAHNQIENQDASTGHNETSLKNHAIVIGFGPSGQEVAYDLAKSQTQVIVIDVNLAAIEKENSHIEFLHGDASRSDILKAAGAETAGLVVITIPDANVAGQMVAQIKSLNKSLPVIVRCRFNRFLEKLKETGADYVLDEETLTGEKMSEQALILSDRIEKNTNKAVEE